MHLTLLSRFIPLLFQQILQCLHEMHVHSQVLPNFLTHLFKTTLWQSLKPTGLSRAHHLKWLCFVPPQSHGRSLTVHQSMAQVRVGSPKLPHCLKLSVTLVMLPRAGWFQHHAYCHTHSKVSFCRWGPMAGNATGFMPTLTHSFISWP